MNVMTLARKQAEVVESTEVENVVEAIAHEDIPSRIELAMTSKDVKSDNYRPQWVGAFDEARSVRAKAYVPADVGIEGGSIELRAKDADVKVLDHGEVRFIWDDKATNVMVKLFVPASEDVSVKSLSLTF